MQYFITPLLLLLLVENINAKKEQLDIVNDYRTAFSIESFGFLQGGSVKVRSIYVHVRNTR